MKNSIFDYHLRNRANLMTANRALSNRIALEKRIFKTIVKDALKAGYWLNINNGGDTNELKTPSHKQAEIIKHSNLTDEEHLLVYVQKDGKFHQIGWVYFVYGNDGWDVVNDYTVNLEDVLKNADKIADQNS